MVELCGELLPADADLLQREMARRRLSLEEQKEQWRSFSHQWVDLVWVRLCLGKVREIDELQALEKSLFPNSVKSASTVAAPERPMQPTVERHFVWLGDRRGVGTEVLRNGISQLAAAGLIAVDNDQQQALRRCLGLALNEQERSSDPPWVLWLGPSDMLNYFVDTLWRMELIHCAGGNRMKWQTLCGAFLRADGTRFVPTIKSNRCTNPEKIKVLNRAFFNALNIIPRSPRAQ